MTAINRAALLPAEWWTREDICVRLTAWFRQHMISVAIDYNFKGTRDVYHATGFYLVHKQRAMWTTAGHVIDEMRTLSSAPGYTIVAARLADQCAVSGAESLPLEMASAITVSTMPFGLDFGAMWLPPMFERALDAAGAVPLTSEVWRGRDTVEPEGFYVLGYPRDRVVERTTRISDRAVRVDLSNTLMAVPVRKIDRRDDDAEAEFWGDLGAFYGEIMPYTGGKVSPDFSVKGMSGGPLFSVVRKPDGGLLYHLHGILRSWSERTRCVRCEPVDRLIAAMGG
jgi:hypothetical protein